MVPTAMEYALAEGWKSLRSAGAFHGRMRILRKRKQAPELGPGACRSAVATLLEQQIIHACDDGNVRLEPLFRARRLLKSKIMPVEHLIVSIDGSRIR
jgi:hypothetical protein